MPVRVDQASEKFKSLADTGGLVLLRDVLIPKNAQVTKRMGKLPAHSCMARGIGYGRHPRLLVQKLRRRMVAKLRKGLLHDWHVLGAHGDVGFCAGSVAKPDAQDVWGQRQVPFRSSYWTMQWQLPSRPASAPSPLAKPQGGF